MAKGGILRKLFQAAGRGSYTIWGGRDEVTVDGWPLKIDLGRAEKRVEMVSGPRLFPGSMTKEEAEKFAESLKQSLHAVYTAYPDETDAIFLVVDLTGGELQTHHFKVLEEAKQMAQGLADRANVVFGPFCVQRVVDAATIATACVEVSEFYLDRYAGSDMELQKEIADLKKQIIALRLKNHDTAHAHVLSFSRLALVNRERCETGYHRLNSWSPNDWMTALAGEVGELANMLKKLRRLSDGPEKAYNKGITPEALKPKIRRELADVAIYLDLLAQRVGEDLSSCVIEKFNETTDMLANEHGEHLRKFKL